MNDEINYKNHPLQGVGLEKMLTEIVDHYGFEILFAYLNINCFKTNPSVKSSVKFLKKTDWAREKVEAFYMYQYKSLPRVSSEQFEISPRDRIIPDGQVPGEPAELSLEDAEQQREKREQKAADYRPNAKKRPASNKPYGANKGARSDARSSKPRADRPDNGRPQSDAPQRSRPPVERTKTERAKPQSRDSDKPASSGNDPWSKWRE